MGRRGRSGRSRRVNGEGYGNVEVWRGCLSYFEKLRNEGAKLVAEVDRQILALHAKRGTLEADIARAPDAIEEYRAKLAGGIIERSFGEIATLNGTRTRNRTRKGRAKEMPLAKIRRLQAELARLEADIAVAATGAADAAS